MSTSTDANDSWDIQQARNLYNIHRWGAEYFDINEAGHVVAKPLQDAGASVDLTDVIEEAKARGLKFPLLIRFQDILRHRVESINLAFRNSIAEFNYQGKYRGVFPIKVNQLREVVEEILDAGKPFDFGLEVGQQAGVVRRPGAAKPDGQPDHLQRLQGRQFHPHGAARHQAGQEGHHGRRETRGTAPDHRRLEAVRCRAADRHPRAAAEQGRREVGGERRRERQVRPEHGRTAVRRRNAQGGEPRRIASSCCISTSARRCRTF